MRKNMFSRVTAVMLSFIIAGTALGGCNDTNTENSKNSSIMSSQSIDDDTEISKKNDFYMAVNKKWIESSELSANEASASCFNECQTNILKFYEKYINELPLKSNLSEDEKKLLILYNQYQEGLSDELKGKAHEYAEKISELQSIKDLEKLYNDKRMSLYNGLFNLELTNTKDSYVLLLTPKSITGQKLSDNPYILNEEDRKAYEKQIKDFLINAGYSDEEATDISQKAVNIESKIAKCFAENISKKETTLHNSGSDFIFAIDFPNLLNNLGYNSDYQDVICSDSYMDLLNDELLTEENVENLKAYFIATVVCTITGNTADSEVSAGLNFYNVADYYMEDMLTDIYLKENIKDEDINNLNEIVEKIVDVYKNKINGIYYLSYDAKNKAMRKIENINVVIAHPKTVISYKNADVSADNSYTENRENCLLAKRNEQNIILQTNYTNDKIIFDTMEVNAYYDVGSNSIIINAGVLQAPIYSRDKSFEENLGGIGTIVAHEISHSLDITGSEYDENGNYKSWWSIDDRKAYIEKATQLKNFMAEQGKKDGLELNAAQTRDEDIADLTGVQCCVEILKNMDNPDYEKFFTDYAQLWREKYSDGTLENLIKYDTHSPSKYRVNVPLQQIDEFYTTFNITEGDGMYLPESERISVW